jgi:hypothetical protein
MDCIRYVAIGVRLFRSLQEVGWFADLPTVLTLCVFEVKVSLHIQTIGVSISLYFPLAETPYGVATKVSSN